MREGLDFISYKRPKCFITLLLSLWLIFSVKYLKNSTMLFPIQFKMVYFAKLSVLAVAICSFSLQIGNCFSLENGDNKFENAHQKIDLSLNENCPKYWIDATWTGLG